MDENIVNLLIQIPLVGAIMWFVIYMARQVQADQDRREERWAKSVRERDERWLGEIDDLHERQEAAQERMVESMTAIQYQITQLVAVILQHDAATVKGVNQEIVARDILDKLMGHYPTNRRGDEAK